MAGYNGYSKSNNAVEAEENGKFPLTKASRIVARKTGITIKEACRILKELGTDEYHHISKFYNITDYYETEPVIYAINLAREFDLSLSNSFIGAFMAYDLAFEDNRKKLDKDEFVESVLSNEWAYSV